MAQSLEKIDLLKERANISYKEAANLLEQFDGNVVEALIHIESTHKERAQEHRQAAYENRKKAKVQTKGFLNEISSTRFVLQNNKNKLIDIPMVIALLLGVVTLPFSIFVLIGLAISGNQIVIKKSGKALKMDQIIKVVNIEEENNQQDNSQDTEKHNSEEE
ncbi:MAG: hypothetical protein ACLFPS_05015 [Clostridia bacterium]